MADRDLHELLDGAERVLLPANAMRWSPRPDTARIEAERDTWQRHAEKAREVADEAISKASAAQRQIADAAGRERQRLAEQLRTDARKVSRRWAGVYRYLAQRLDAGGGDLT